MTGLTDDKMMEQVSGGNTITYLPDDYSDLLKDDHASDLLKPQALIYPG